MLRTGTSPAPVAIMPTDFLAALASGPILLAVFGFVFAGFVKGTTGLGFSTTCLAFLVLALGVEVALPLVLVPSITTNLTVQFQTGHVRESLNRFWPMFAATLPGMVLGLWLLATIDRDIAAAILGGVLVVYGVYTLATPAIALSPSRAASLRTPVGFLTGTVNGLTGSQIMPILPYLLSQPLKRPLFLQVININFTMSSLVMALGLSKLGFLTPTILLYSVLALIPSGAGLWLGSRLRQYLPNDAFRTAVLVTIIALGTILASRAFL